MESVEDGKLFRFHKNPNPDCPVGRNIHTLLDDMLEDIQAVMEQEMLDFVRDYNVDAKPEKIFSLEQVPDAHRYLESSDSYGKVVCMVASCV